MLKIGILGGGQLGKMLLQAAANYPVETFVMENEDDCPAAHLCHHFTKGDIKNFDDVYQFGKQLNALTIEIESVNEDALEKLEAEGVGVRLDRDLFHRHLIALAFQLRIADLVGQEDSRAIQ